MQGYIYKITNLINNKLYIGKTSQTVEKRWKNHYYEARRWKKCQDTGADFGYNSRLYPAMIKYGYENFTIQLIEAVDSLEALNSREKYWVDFYDTRNNGYNIAAGGTGGFFLGCKHTPEAIEKLRIAATGRKQSPESIAKSADAKRGKRASQEAREKMRNAKLGKKTGKHSKEWRQHISEGHINEVICIETGVTYYNLMEAERQTGVRRQSISANLTGKYSHAGGYHWQYKNKK